MKKTMVIAAVAAVAVAGTILFACGHRPPMHGSIEKKADWAAEKIADKLDFTKEQRIKLDALKVQVVAKFKEVHERNKGERDQVLALVKKDRLTREDLQKIADKRKALHEEMKPFVIDKIIEFHSMLDSKQKEKAAELMDEMHRRHGM